jgi:hypothetical protein
MDFPFFEGLSEEEARLFLANFLDVEGRTVEALLGDARRAADVGMPFSVESASRVLRWLADQVRVTGHPPDPSLPVWLKGPAYARGLVALDQPSRVLTLRGGYYLGETFVRSFGSLEWAIGDREAAVCNQPVVRGFSSSLEMSPLLVCENLFLRIVADGAPATEIDRALSFWSARAG